MHMYNMYNDNRILYKYPYIYIPYIMICIYIYKYLMTTSILIHPVKIIKIPFISARKGTPF